MSFPEATGLETGGQARLAEPAGALCVILDVTRYTDNPFRPR